MSYIHTNIDVLYIHTNIYIYIHTHTHTNIIYPLKGKEILPLQQHE